MHADHGDGRARRLGAAVNPLALEFMQRALRRRPLLVGLAAPAVGVFLVQRRLALMGDGSATSR